MNMKSRLKSRMLAFEAKQDLHLFGVYRGPDGKYYRADGEEAKTVDDFKSVGGAVRGAAAVGAGVGAVAGGRALMGRYGADQATSFRKGVQATARGVGRDVAGAVGTAKGFVGNKINVGAEAFRKGVIRDKGKFANRSILRGVKGAVSAVTGGRVRFSEKVKNRLVELGSKLETISA